MKKSPSSDRAKKKAEDQTGKARGKRDDPDYLQTTVYLSRDLHRSVKVALAETDGELSGLVETLLSE